MILVDEYLALLALADRLPVKVRGERLALTYSRAYRLTRALLDPGPGRLAIRAGSAVSWTPYRQLTNGCSTTEWRTRTRLCC